MYIIVLLAYLSISNQLHYFSKTNGTSQLIVSGAGYGALGKSKSFFLFIYKKVESVLASIKIVSTYRQSR